MKKIPIKTAKEIAKKQDFNQVLIFGWDKNESITSVATYGKSQTDCDQIAQLGNWFKKNMLKWPENKCCAEPHRVKKLKQEKEQLINALISIRVKLGDFQEKWSSREKEVDEIAKISIKKKG